ncbi:MAG: integrase family protein [Alphaproteobacteria bacterium]|nr:integrase family protein [Alphaproteobacteria bacterium]
MPTIALTDRTIPHLKPVPGKQVIYLDRTLKGFGVRVSDQGRMSFVLTYGANRQRIKLGDVGVVKLADAREQARNILAERQLGMRQATGRETYERALAAFLEAAKAKNKERTVRDYTRLLTSYGFGAEHLADIGARDIHRKLDSLANRPSEQAHALAALKIFFRFCVRRHLLDTTPMERFERPTRARSRSRVLSETELTRVWLACENTGVFGKIVRLCILLGQRRSEIAHLEWAWIDEHERTITLPSQLMKNSREHRFPYGDMTAALFATIPRGEHLFPARKTWRGGGTVYNAWNKDKPKLDAASGVTDWVLHDLRRTFVSSWAALGTRLEVTEKYVNHVSGTHSGIVGIYQRHSFMPEMRAATKIWEEKLRSMLSLR